MARITNSAQALLSLRIVAGMLALYILMLFLKAVSVRDMIGISAYGAGLILLFITCFYTHIIAAVLIVVLATVNLIGFATFIYRAQIPFGFNVLTASPPVIFIFSLLIFWLALAYRRLTFAADV